MARISELVHYPVKGCAGVPLSTAELTHAGIRHDRSFMVVDDSGGFRSQRKDPRMARVRPEVVDDVLRLTTDGIEPLTVKIDPEGPRLDVTLHGLPFVGVDQGEPAAAWLTEVFGSSSRLVRVPDDHRREVSGLTPGTSGFADSTAVLMASTASLELLNGRILETGSEPVPIHRFRPNLVISGWTEPHTEDRVRAVRAGTAELGYAKVCIRCAVTTVDQESGEKRGPEPLRALAGYRRADDGGVSFGAKFSVIRPGVLSVGDELDVTAWGEAEQGLGERLAAVLS
ncbi:MOSC N-terminal beta barrel domain-containing protein [Nocardiopsis sp. N85]|uniref:MOSC domain-containing protein n=1 Tax=Nocardiopsis sp. N85 TaxID=3029400 RepID=UPI00237FB737|nr:MOSC N-terminal beta barrel domain-containing protein [Nocardiopsis sp. N85]MDE3720759.1 MOSC N-terminal beta barrel domain-containing protein [Nocardiopsis sp. N85]